MTRYLIIAMLLVILYNLGAGLYYMMKDKGTNDRTVKALTRRMALSVTLFLLLILGMATGIIEPHSVTPKAPKGSLSEVEAG